MSLPLCCSLQHIDSHFRSPGCNKLTHASEVTFEVPDFLYSLSLPGPSYRVQITREGGSTHWGHSGALGGDLRLSGPLQHPEKGMGRGGGGDMGPVRFRAHFGALRKFGMIAPPTRSVLSSLSPEQRIHAGSLHFNIGST